MAKKIRFIVNPFSGISRKENLGKLLQSGLDLDLIDMDLHYTEGPGHATTLSASARDKGFDMVVAVGGDGTVNEVARALIHSDTVLGILPGGSGNGFATHLGISRNMEKAVQVINKGKIITVDTCRANDEFYINVAGVGFNAKVAYETKLMRSRGFFAYFWGAAKHSLFYKNGEYDIRWGDRHFRGKLLALEVANASFFGYNFAIAPQANLQDGVLDLVMIKHAPKPAYLLSLWRFFAHNIHKSSIVNIHPVTEVTVSSEAPMYYHLDGEGKLAAENEMKFRIVPQSLKVWVPG